MPSSLHAQMTRRAISPRLAIRILLNTADPHGEEPVPELDGAAVLDVHGGDFPVRVALDFVHELHRFDDAEHLPLAHLGADFNEVRRTWLGGPVEGADDRRLHDAKIDFR